ncbi:MAG: hypothetical protein ACK4G3_06050 [bacterium]
MTLLLFLSALLLSGEGTCSVSLPEQKTACQGDYHFQWNSFTGSMKEWEKSGDTLKARSLSWKFQDNVDGKSNEATISLTSHTVEFSGSVSLSSPMGSLSTDFLLFSPEGVISTKNPVQWSYGEITIDASGVDVDLSEELATFYPPIHITFSDLTISSEQLLFHKGTLSLTQSSLSHSSFQVHCPEFRWEAEGKKGNCPSPSEMKIMKNDAFADKVELDFSQPPGKVILKGNVRVIISEKTP